MTEKKDNAIEKEELIVDSEADYVQDYIFRYGPHSENAVARATTMRIRFVFVGVVFCMCLLMYYAKGLNTGVTRQLFIIENSIMFLLLGVVQILDAKMIKEHYQYKRTLRTLFNIAVLYSGIYIFCNIVFAVRFSFKESTADTLYLKLSFLLFEITIVSFVISIFLITYLIRKGYFRKKRKVLIKARTRMPYFSNSYSWIGSIIIAGLMGALTSVSVMYFTSARWEKVFIAFCILFVLLGYGFAHLYQKIKLAEEYGLDTALFSQVNRQKTASHNKGTVNSLYGKYYAIVAKGNDGTIYIGWTQDVNERIAALNNGKGPKYTKSHDPFTLIYEAEFSSKEWAEQRVDYLKGLSDSDRELFLDNHKNHRKYKAKHIPK